MQIFVGNIPADMTEEGLKTMFQEYGTVASAIISINKKTGASEGYAIIEMPVKSEARAAADGLRGKEMNGQPLRVKVLKPGDPFHNAALGHGQSQGAKASMPFRGDSSYRGSGAIRRGGQRGS